MSFSIYQNYIRTLAIVSVVIFVALFPLRSHAAVVFQQLDQSLAQNASGNPPRVYVGTGVGTGVIPTLSVTVIENNLSNDSGTKNQVIEIWCGSTPLGPSDPAYHAGVGCQQAVSDTLVITGSRTIGTDYVRTYTFQNFQFQAGYYYHIQGVFGACSSVGACTGVSPGGGYMRGTAVGSSCVNFCGNLNDVYYVMDDGAVPGPPCTMTCVLSTVPPDEATISTSTAATVGGTAYINPDEWLGASDWFVRVRYAWNFSVQASVATPDLLFTTLEFPVSASGNISYSTTTPVINGGRYTMITEIRRASIVNTVLGWFGLGSLFDNGLIAATTTQFIGTAPNQYDNFVASTTEQLEAFSGTASSTLSLNQCAALNITGCVTYFFGYQSQPMSSLYSQVANTLFTFVPFGYVTRFAEIMGGSGTTSLPAISYTAVSSSTTELQGKNYSIQLFDYFGTLETITADDGSNKNILDIVMPFFNTVIAFAVLYVVLGDLFGISIESDETAKTTTTRSVNMTGGQQQGPVRYTNSSRTRK